jgi:hypothetical protein
MGRRRNAWTIPTEFIGENGGHGTVLRMVVVWRHYDRNRKYSSGKSGSGTEYELL